MVGRFVARMDFAWPQHRLALEYDGLWDAQSRPVRRDRRRLNDLVTAGWRVLFVTAAHLPRPEALLGQPVAALRG